jgi:hypothetical protein
VPARQLAGLVRLGRESGATFAAIDEGKRGLLDLDGRLANELSGRQHGSSGLKDVNEYLHRALHIALRQSLGKHPGTGARGNARVWRSRERIAFKDIIVPGDIREILNQVVAAEKQAQANLIRRREE